MSLSLEQQFTDANCKLKFLLENMQGGFFTYDAKTLNLIELSPGLLAMFKCDESAFREHFYNSFDMMICQEERTQTMVDIEKQAQSGGDIHVQFKMKDMYNGDMRVDYRGRCVQESNGAVRCYVVLTDVTMRDELQNEEQQSKVQIDDMTGILNREAMQKSIREFLRTSSSNELHAMMMIDTDNFKGLNDTLGHVFGDEVIKFVARTIKNTFRQSDFVGRVGGDEFMVFMKNTTKEVTQQRAQSLNKDLCRKFARDGKSTSISCSIGIAYYPKDGMDYDSLLSNADDALYQAKQKGKNRYVISS